MTMMMLVMMMTMMLAMFWGSVKFLCTNSSVPSLPLADHLWHAITTIDEDDGDGDDDETKTYLLPDHQSYEASN